MFHMLFEFRAVPFLFRLCRFSAVSACRVGLFLTDLCFDTLGVFAVLALREAAGAVVAFSCVNRH